LNYFDQHEPNWLNALIKLLHILRTHPLSLINPSIHVVILVIVAFDLHTIPRRFLFNIDISGKRLELQEAIIERLVLLSLGTSN